MKFKDFITNLMGSTFVIVPLLYLFTDWFYALATGEPNYSHYMDMMLFPMIGFVYMLLSRGKPITKFVLWTNLIAFVFLFILSIMFFRSLDNGAYIPSERDITEIIESNDKYYVVVSDTLDYYIEKSDTITYDTTSWKVYRFVRDDMFNDTIFGTYSLSNGDNFLYLNNVGR